MRKWVACLMMVCVVGSASAQSSARGESDDKNHPRCEGQHDCRDYQNSKSNGSGNNKSAAKKGGSKTAHGESSAKSGNTAPGKGGKVAGTHRASNDAVHAGVGIAAGVGLIAVGLGSGHDGHHVTRALRASSP